MADKTGSGGSSVKDPDRCSDATAGGAIGGLLMGFAAGASGGAAIGNGPGAIAGGLLGAFIGVFGGALAAQGTATACEPVPGAGSEAGSGSGSASRLKGDGWAIMGALVGAGAIGSVYSNAASHKPSAAAIPYVLIGAVAGAIAGHKLSTGLS